MYKYDRQIGDTTRLPRILVDFLNFVSYSFHFSDHNAMVWLEFQDSYITLPTIYLFTDSTYLFYSKSLSAFEFRSTLQYFILTFTYYKSLHLH